jgi:hypothetical protein
MFALTKNLTDPSPVLKAVTNGWGVVKLEDALALDFEAFVQQMVGRISLGTLIALTYFYVAGMWLGLTGTAAIVFLKDRAAYIDLRRTFVLTMIFAAFVFTLYPLAPPRFMPGLGMTDTVTLVGLDPGPHSDSAISYNRFAAMPSLHFTWALLVMVAAFKVGGTWVKVGGFVYQALMFVAIIATANHYVLDAVAGAILLMVALFVNRLWNHYNPKTSQWTSGRLETMRKFNHQRRRRVGDMHASDLRELFLSGFILRGGYASPPSRSQITKHQPFAPMANIQRSFRPELNNLSLALN